MFFAGGSETIHPLWTLQRASEQSQREEDERLLEARLKHRLRSIFNDSLLTDPKSRKILLVEHPLLPLYVKEIIARILFNNLQVPSVSFLPSSLLALLAVGRVTGLVVDCGHLESTTLPIFASRPLYPHLKTTPLAGNRLSQHLRALLLWFGTYYPPPTTLSGAVNLPSTSRATRVPEEVLTESLLETIKSCCLFVGAPLTESPSPPDASSPTIEVPPEAQPRSESDFSRISADASDNSAFSVVSHAHLGEPPLREGGGRLEAIAALYKRHSTATDVRLRVVPPVSQQTGTGRGTLVIPGWIRERAAEMLFEGGDDDEGSVVEIVLESLLKVPIDLRKTLASSILLIGGTVNLPGFIPRLHAELAAALSSTQPSPTLSPQSTRRTRAAVPKNHRYAPLRSLLSHLAILNDPSPNVTTTTAALGLAASTQRPPSMAGKAPAFSPTMLAWVGGSLAGALKISGTEVPRERWDELGPSQFEVDDLQFVIDMHPSTVVTSSSSSTGSVLPDWTRSPLPSGAPSAHMGQMRPTPSAMPSSAIHA